MYDDLPTKLANRAARLEFTYQTARYPICQNLQRAHLAGWTLTLTALALFALRTDELDLDSLKKEVN